VYLYTSFRAVPGHNNNDRAAELCVAIWNKFRLAVSEFWARRGDFRLDDAWIFHQAPAETRIHQSLSRAATAAEARLIHRAIFEFHGLLLWAFTRKAPLAPNQSLFALEGQDVNEFFLLFIAVCSNLIITFPPKGK
jgi:hypothetical protein